MPWNMKRTQQMKVLHPHSQKLSWESYKDVNVVTEICNYRHQHWCCVESCMWHRTCGQRHGPSENVRPLLWWVGSVSWRHRSEWVVHVTWLTKLSSQNTGYIHSRRELQECLQTHLYATRKHPCWIVGCTSSIQTIPNLSHITFLSKPLHQLFTYMGLCKWKATMHWEKLLQWTYYIFLHRQWQCWTFGHGSAVRT